MLGFRQKPKAKCTNSQVNKQKMLRPLSPDSWKERNSVCWPFLHFLLRAKLSLLAGLLSLMFSLGFGSSVPTAKHPKQTRLKFWGLLNIPLGKPAKPTKGRAAKAGPKPKHKDIGCFSRKWPESIPEDEFMKLFQMSGIKGWWRCNPVTEMLGTITAYLYHLHFLQIINIPMGHIWMLFAVLILFIWWCHKIKTAICLLIRLIRIRRVTTHSEHGSLLNLAFSTMHRCAQVISSQKGLAWLYPQCITVTTAC